MKHQQAFSLGGETTLIADGGIALGFGIARFMAAAGARVVLVGRSAEQLSSAAAEIGSNAFFVKHDVTRPRRPHDLPLEQSFPSMGVPPSDFNHQ